MLNDRINLAVSGGAEWLSRTKPNKRFDPSGISLILIENLNHSAETSRRVNRGVRFLLNDRDQRYVLAFTGHESQASS
jgi:hypothetical protein